MFDGKDEVRDLNGTVYDGPEHAQQALVAACAPSDRFVLAVRLTAGGAHDVAATAAHED